LNKKIDQNADNNQKQQPHKHKIPSTSEIQHAPAITETENKLLAKRKKPNANPNRLIFINFVIADPKGVESYIAKANDWKGSKK